MPCSEALQRQHEVLRSEQRQSSKYKLADIQYVALGYVHSNDVKSLFYQEGVQKGEDAKAECNRKDRQQKIMTPRVCFTGFEWKETSLKLDI